MRLLSRRGLWPALGVVSLILVATLAGTVSNHAGGRELSETPVPITPETPAMSQSSSRQKRRLGGWQTTSR